MKSDTLVFGRIVKKYKIPLDEIDDLNLKYEEASNKLNSFGHRLAGRLSSELEFTAILQSTKMFKTITKCMEDYINSLSSFNLLNIGNHQLNILSCWINDMKEGEYNPPHTHHNGTGFSVVLFLNIPEYINDVKDPHKFHDGQLGFGGFENQKIWIEPEVGDFFIFNANHTHYVMPFKVKTKGETRRSMSFNFIATPIGKNEKK